MSKSHSVLKKQFIQLLRKEKYAIIVTFSPLIVEELISYLSRDYFLIFTERTRLTSEYKRKYNIPFNKRYEKEKLTVKISYSIQDYLTSENSLTFIVHPTYFKPSQKDFSLFLKRKVIFAYPHEIEFSCYKEFGFNCSKLKSAMEVLWETKDFNSCHSECQGLWELIFGKYWWYFYPKKQKATEITLLVTSFLSLKINGKKETLKVANKCYQILRTLKGKALSVEREDSLLIIPLGFNIALKIEEGGDFLELGTYEQMAFAVEANYLSQIPTFNQIKLNKIPKWLEEKNVKLDGSFYTFIRNLVGHN